jgi:HD-GYP domain-containing protein (c-di-GMP phosphodiesterase class II)
MDIRPFEDFIFSLAPVSGIDYQVWDVKGEMIFSTGRMPSEESSIEDIQKFSKRVIEQEVYQYTPCGGHYLCGIPFKNGIEVVGALLAFGKNLHKTSDTSHAKEMEDFLGNLTTLMEDHLNAENEIEDMAQELDHSFEDLNLYSKIATKLRTLRISSEMLGKLLEELLENMRSDMAFTFFHDRPQYKVLVSKDEFTDKVNEQEKFVHNLLSGIPIGSPSLEESYFVVNDSRENPHYRGLASAPYRFLVVKAEYNDKFYGWLGLVSFNLKEIFRQGELKLLISLAEQLAIVTANSDLYDDLEKFIINMVKSLVFAIEAKDSYTRGHSERVSNFSLLMGERLNLSEKEFNDLRWAAILHDIGKIGIPESILNKPDALTDAEFEIIKAHPGKGGEILRPVQQLLGSLPAIVHHHERYDGRGYPFGLKGEDIPLAARIIAVADTFDAISSSRAYRSARSHEKALEIMEEVAGSQLDPRLVSVFKEILKQGLISGE